MKLVSNYCRLVVCVAWIFIVYEYISSTLFVGIIQSRAITDAAVAYWLWKRHVRRFLAQS